MLEEFGLLKLPTTLKHNDKIIGNAKIYIQNMLLYNYSFQLEPS